MIINDVEFNASLEAILSELKSQLSLSGINYFREFRDSGENIMTQCPYHKGGQERKPSAGFLKKDGTFHCFTCGEVHTLAEVISYCFAQDETGMFGWRWLLKNFSTVSIESRKDIDLDLDRNRPKENSVEYVSEEELDSYRYYHPYMYERKLTNEIIERFDVGFDNSTNCITFPVRDISGGTLFIARRSVETKYFNYPCGAKKPIYGVYELSRLDRKADEVIICESILDALYFWTVGKYAVALNGLGSESQFEELNNLPYRKYILCTDSDEAGMKARKRIRANLKNKIITEYILPDGRKDANDCTIDELKSLQEVF